MPVSAIPPRNSRIELSVSPGHRSRQAGGRDPVGAGERAALDVGHGAQSGIDRLCQRSRGDDRQVVLQVDLRHLGREERRHGGGRGIRPARQQCRSRGARHVVGGDAQQLGVARVDAHAVAHPVVARGEQPRDVLLEPLTPDGVGALAQNRADVDGQALQPRGREKGPALAGRVDHPGAAGLGGHPATRVEGDEAGAGGDVEQAGHPIEIDAHGRRKTLAVGQRDTAAGEFAGRLQVEGGDELGDRRGRLERVLGCHVIRELHVDTRHRAERRRGRQRHEFVQARQAETRPELQLFRHGSRYHPAAEVLGEQGKTRGGGQAFGQQCGVGS